MNPMGGLANINPMVLLQLGGALLQPGPTQGARIGAGLASLPQAMMMQMQMQMQQKAFEKQSQVDDALARLADPLAYEPSVTPVDPGVAAANPEYAANGALDSMSPSKYSPMGDMMRVAPGAVIEGRVKQMMDPMGEMPDEIKKLLYYARNPELADLAQTLDPTGPMAALQAAGIRPGTPEARDFLTRRGQTLIDMRQQGAFETAEGQRYSKDIVGPISTAAVAANVELQKINRAKDLLTKFTSGAIAPATGALSNLVQSLGMDPSKFNLDKAAPKEAFTSISNDFTLTAMERLKGVASDSDMKLLRAMQASVGGTLEGNLMILDLAERIWSKANGLNDAVQTYLSGTNNRPQGVEKAIAEYWRKNPLYGQDEAKNIEKFINNARVPNSPEAIKLMNAAELGALDVTKLTPAQKAAFRQRYMMLNGTMQ